MKKHLAEIAFRRCELLEKIEAQRVEMSELSVHFEKPMQIVDTGVSTFNFVRRHPTLIAGSLSAVLTYWRYSTLGISWLIPPILQYTFNRILSASNSKCFEPSDFNSSNCD